MSTRLRSLVEHGWLYLTFTFNETRQRSPVNRVFFLKWWSLC